MLTALNSRISFKLLSITHRSGRSQWQVYGKDNLVLIIDYFIYDWFWNVALVILSCQQYLAISDPPIINFQITLWNMLTFFVCSPVGVGEDHSWAEWDLGGEAEENWGHPYGEVSEGLGAIWLPSYFPCAQYPSCPWGVSAMCPHTQLVRVCTRLTQHWPQH